MPSHSHSPSLPASRPEPRRAVVIQSSYVPWKGYLDMVHLADEFVLYDDVQFTKNDWRNRNLIKAGDDTLWLTIPVLHKGRFGQTIDQVEVVDGRWAAKHWRSLETWYGRAEAFDQLAPRLSELYQQAGELGRLTEINELFLRALVDLLGFDTRITRVTEYDLPEDRVERLAELCVQLEVDEYVSGPAAAAYLEPGPFAERRLEVRWMSYRGYPEYPQLGGGFVHGVSVLDLLLNVGPEVARRYLLTTAESLAGRTLPVDRPDEPVTEAD